MGMLFFIKCKKIAYLTNESNLKNELGTCFHR